MSNTAGESGETNWKPATVPEEPAAVRYPAVLDIE